MSKPNVSRRALLKVAAALPLPVIAGAAEFSSPLTPEHRQKLVFDLKRDTALSEFTTPNDSQSNEDEQRYSDRRASFSKTMPHNDLGEVEPEAYNSWLSILASGKSAGFARAPRDPHAVERLNNPQASYAIDLLGADPTALPLTPAPAFASFAAASEMAELYWLALTRDVPFQSYGSNPLAQAAVADLRSIGFPNVSSATLFRGETSGDLRGPFVSQFLWRDIPFGLQTIEQRFPLPSRDQDFLSAFDDWLACQRGAHARRSQRLEAEPRYISTYRDLAEYVHRDFSFQAFMNAALIALRMGGDRVDPVLSPSNPYRGSKTEFGDITFGNKNLLTLIAEASLLAQKTAYYQKWQIHRRARPESFGARIDVHQDGRKTYDIHPAILQSDGLARIKAAKGTWLLPQAYPEGCPTHPAYPAAHAVNAGACATVLKAFLDDGFVIPAPIEATSDGKRLEAWLGQPLTLGDEIDKLAANIALARDAAGVHFRSDSIDGLRLGESVGIALLADQSRTYNEAFDGFLLRRLNGTRIRVSNGAVVPLPS